MRKTRFCFFFTSPVSDADLMTQSDTLKLIFGICVRRFVPLKPLTNFKKKAMTYFKEPRMSIRNSPLLQCLFLIEVPEDGVLYSTAVFHTHTYGK